MDEVPRGILASLPLAVHDPGIVSFSINVMHLYSYVISHWKGPNRNLHLGHETGWSESGSSLCE